VKQIVPQLWGISNGTFVTDKVGDIEISFVEYSASKKVCLQLDIVEYSPGDQAPMYDLHVVGHLYSILYKSIFGMLTRSDAIRVIRPDR
jgi:hypothetical protein